VSAIDDFRNKLSSDQAFAERVKGCHTAGEILAVAELEGIKLDTTDLAKAVQMGSNELSDDELESVSSGTPLAALLIK
jgi:predicted ribosomally synthesized peptide with nif11-like leader